MADQRLRDQIDQLTERNAELKKELDNERKAIQTLIKEKVSPSLMCTYCHHSHRTRHCGCL